MAHQAPQPARIGFMSRVWTLGVERAMGEERLKYVSAFPKVQRFKFPSIAKSRKLVIAASAGNL
jgi:hypothetical protein